MTLLIKLAAYSVFLSICGTAIAEDKNVNFILGEQHFNQSKHEQALLFFNKALEDGITSSGLYYSLGSTYYKIEDYNNARKYFQKLTTNNKYSPLAHYNLGLIANKNNDDKTAIKHFKISETTSSNDKLIKLSAKQINTLKNKKKKKKKKNDWSGYALGGFGYDSNITSDPDNLATNQSGSFGYANALANYVISGSKRKGLVAKSSVYAKDYFSLNSSDHKFINLGLSFRTKANDWKFIYDINLKQSDYAHEDYQRAYMLTLAARHKLRNNNELRLRWRYEDINSLSPQFDYLEGSRQKLRAEYRINRTTDRFKFLYELEINDRQNTATSNYSPTRHSIAVKYNNKLNKNNAVGGDITYRVSDYDATATENRSDNRISTSLKHTYDFTNAWKLKSSIKHTTNDSNEPDSDYDRTLFTVDLYLNF